MASGKFQPLSRGIRKPISYALGGIICEQPAAGMDTPAKLAERAGLKRQALILIETNKRVARIETTERIGRALGVLGGLRLALAERRAMRWPARC